MHKLELNCALCDASSISFLQHCTPEQYTLIMSNKLCNHYKKGEHIFYEDSMPSGLHCLSSGIVKMVRTNKEGKEQILRFAKPGDFLGYRALIADEPLVATAICVEDAVCCLIPKDVFIELLEQNSTISRNMLKALSHDLGVAEERIQSLAQKSVRERLAEALLFLHDTFNAEKNATDEIIHVTLPREDIANIVGTATETVIRLLSEFKSDKLIEVEGKKIKLLDKQKLHKISHATVN